MDYQTSSYVAWTVVAMLIVMIIAGHYMYADRYVGPSKEFRGFADVDPPPPKFLPTTPYYGEDNPINAYEQKIEKKQYDCTNKMISDALDNSLVANGHVNESDFASHRNYMQKNAHKIPRISAQIIRDDTRQTNSSYVGGTRAMSMMPIVRIGESRVPDRVQAPLKNIWASPVPAGVVS